ncbi:McrB family protein [Terrilactibacillus laevilacticus]|uniref:McrB family protein n=1 Tax=Terrilactibacillus laevilacticus TaxID=1380157 RepID=A0ABW5PU42_9BACI|nr:hypothetical protein [Terrilactibacillus laevilacticus]
MLNSPESTILGNYYLGRLAKPDEVPNHLESIFETNGRYRINIKIVSEIKGDLEKELLPLNNIVKALDNRIRPEYGYDNRSKIEKRKELQRDLNTSLIVFQLERREGYYNVYNPVLKTKNSDYNSDDEYEAIPYFRVNNVDYFINQLHTGNPISELKRLMQNSLFEDKIFDNHFIPPYILIQEGNDDVYAYGPLNDVNLSTDGVSLIFSNEASKISTNDEDFLLDNYSNADGNDGKNVTCYFIQKHWSYSFLEALKKNETLKIKEKKIADDKKNDASDLQRNDLNGEEITDTSPSGVSIEQKILKRFKKSAENNGLYYDDADLVNFHTAMKTGNLVILAGMSGTGKSKIVNCYAQALGLEDRGNFKKIPVRPFWQDDSDLIGYLDVINNIYRPGDSGLIDFLFEADKEENKDKLYIVCFDEMNLARVEHYFSQFLSVLEEDPNGQRKIRLYNRDFQNRLYNSQKYNDTLNIGDNVLFVGTVNLDESTFQFSDKVLDRANVIHLKLRNFKEVAEAAKKANVTDSIGTATFTKEQYFGTRPLSMENQSFQLLDNELDFLWELHERLHKSNDKIGVGLRIVRQIDCYLQCLPSTEYLSRTEAFDLQVTQRILTKISGGEDQLNSLIGTYDKTTDTVSNSELLDLFERYKKSVSELIESRKKITSLAKELLMYGHTL